MIMMPNENIQEKVEEKKIKRSDIAIAVIVFVIILSASLWVYTTYFLKEPEIKDVRLPGHEGTIYAFSYDIRETLKIPVNDEEAIVDALVRSDKVNIVYKFHNESSLQDSKYFSVLMINVISKVTTFFSYEEIILSDFPVYYIDENNTWHNSTGDMIAKPNFTDATLWLVGPNTGAKDTSVTIIEKDIYISGTSYENLIKAGDRFVLAVMGIDSV